MAPPKDFRSLVSGVDDVDTMSDYLCPALGYQSMFTRKTSPWEMSEWNYDELQRFEVDLEDVDRLYYIHHTDDACGSTFHLLARMRHKSDEERRLFVEFSAGCDYTGFECQGGGEIFVTFHANVFFQTVLREDYNRAGLYESLLSDGYHIDEYTDYNPRRGFVKNAPMLKFLCHVAINENRDRLQHYPLVLPKILSESVEEFIKIRETIQEYDEL